MLLVTPWLFTRGHHQDKEWKVSPRADLNPVFLHAEVVGAAGHVGQRTDEVVAALKRWIQQHCTHLLHLLQPQNTQGGYYSSFKSWQFVSVQFFVSLQQASLQLLSDNLPAGHERRLQRRVKRSQKAPWDIGPHVVLLPPSYSQTFQCHESAHLRERETNSQCQIGHHHWLFFKA